MTQITEDFVSFETAKLLKEKGFNEQVKSYYTESGLEGYMLALKATKNTELDNGFISRPTIQMTMKWLREKEWFICIIPLVFYDGEKVSKFGYNIWADDNLEVDEFNTPVFYTYEDACNAAINYCLKYLNQI